MNTIKTTNNCFKALGTNSEVVDFQGWSKMTLKIKWPISPFLDVGFEKFFDSHLWNYTGELKMITWN